MGRLRRLQDAAGIRLLEAYGCYRLFLYMASHYLVPAMQNCFGEKCVAVERIYITLFYGLTCLIMAQLCKGSVHLPVKKLSLLEIGSLFSAAYFACSIGDLFGKGALGAVNLLCGDVLCLSFLAEHNLGAFDVAYTVALAPVLEEAVFRKALCGQLLPYGKLVAAVVSAISFGLFHGGSETFFYATAAGFVFSLVYMKTGNVGYAILLHAIINGFDCMREFLWLNGWGNVTNILAILTGICGAVTSILYLRKKRRWLAALLNAFWVALRIPGMGLFLLVAAVGMVKNG